MSQSGIFREKMARLATIVAIIILLSYQPYGCVPTTPIEKPTEPSTEYSQSEARLDPIPRYGGTVLTAQRMPSNRTRAYLWAKNMGTLVAYETFLRRHPEGGDADHFRKEIRRKFVPADKEWQEAWLLYSQLEIIDGAICDPEEGLIVIGRPGKGRLPPFFYEDLIAALRCTMAGEKVGVTMNRIFPARFAQPVDPSKPPYEAYETSVDFLSNKLWNTHLAYILFEGDRMLKSLSAGFDIFRGEPIRASVPSFATQVEMEAESPSIDAKGSYQMEMEYGRVWIELTSVKINTTETKNAAVFADFQMDVRAESEYMPPRKFAKHLQDHYSDYADEFPIFGEVERAARIVAIAQWLRQTYPSVTEKIVAESYKEVEVFVPQVIRARWDKTYESNIKISGLIGGVVFPNVNDYQIDPESKVADTRLAEVQSTVLESRPYQGAIAWLVPFGEQEKDKYIAWNVAVSKDTTLETTQSVSMATNDKERLHLQ